MFTKFERKVQNNKKKLANLKKDHESEKKFMNLRKKIMDS